MTRININKKIIEKFNNQKNFSREELLQYCKKIDSDLNINTFAWRLYDLKSKNLIHEIKQGLYIVSEKQVFKPIIEKKIKTINKLLNEFYKDVKIVYWSTAWLNKLSLHQTFHNFFILETERDLVESIFFKLNELNIENIFVNPDSEIINRYVIGKNEPIIIKNLISRSPTVKSDEINISTIEKILVDLFADSKTFYMYQGHELKVIFRNAIDQYTINYTTLFYYAGRRGKDKEIKKYLRKNFNEVIGDIIND
ncbi:MAG: hypothetical protein M0P71_05000 [Melioribacteraceae bacterium]|nr:hypothetical protein [Melioribacteraceae bacterium]